MNQTLARSLLTMAGLTLGTFAVAQDDARPAGLGITSNNAIVSPGGTVTVNATVSNTSGMTRTLSLGRNSFQHCAFAPHVRVLRVGTREVVYPSGEPRVCTQELRTETIPGNGRITFTRDIELDPGEYVVEVWVKGFMDDAQIFLPGEPVRIKVADANGTARPANTSVQALSLAARLPEAVPAGASFNATLTVTNTSGASQKVDPRLCPVGIEAKSVNGERTVLQNVAAVLCMASTTSESLQPGQRRTYTVPVPAIHKAGQYTLTFTTFTAGTAAANVSVR